MDLKTFGAKPFAQILESAFKVELARRICAPGWCRVWWFERAEIANIPRIISNLFQ